MTIPETYRDTIERFLAVYGEWLGYQLQAYNPAHDLAETGISRQLAFIAQAAAGGLPRDDDEELEEWILSSVANLLARLYYAPGIGNVDDVDVPDVFWAHPLGEMCARALLWALEGELITLQEAADLARVSVQAISQAVGAGRIAGYVDPDASERQGRTLVKRVDVQNTQWKRSDATGPTNPYRNPAKRRAFEEALKLLKVAGDFGDYTYETTMHLCTHRFDLSEANARDVTLRAIRVERARRRKAAIEDREIERQRKADAEGQTDA